MSPAAATSSGRVAELIEAALAAAQDLTIDRVTRCEMLMELAMGLQTRPKTPDQLHAAIELYEKALSLCPEDDALLAARLTARRATALQAVPSDRTAELEQARDGYEEAIPILGRLGNAQELAEAEMNLGLVLQQLASAGRARIGDAIAAYQRSLRTFQATRYPVEFVLLQNNLATAYLSMPAADHSARVREALAVQCFEAGLKIVTLTRNPVEYAMLQNNLANALQHATSGHPVANNLRALAAYDEALRVRRRATMPLEYANTIANRANCLCNLPDDLEQPEHGNAGNLARAAGLYAEAHEIFSIRGETGKAQLVAAAIAEIEAELAAAPAGDGSGVATP